jgi:hypothetical protein
VGTYCHVCTWSGGEVYPRPVSESLKTFHGKLFVDLQVLLVTPDSTKSWTPAGREMHLGPFACHTAVDHLAANPDITGQLPALSHLHVALRTPYSAWRCFAATGLCVVTVLA